MGKESNQKQPLKMNRRTFISTGMALGAVTIIPNHVFAARKKGKVAPSDKICLLHIGCGTEGQHATVIKSSRTSDHCRSRPES